jgi:trehalose 6-phosphate phosphatase
LIYALSPEGRAQLDAVVATGALLAFDIDGTLAPIVERPDDARLPDDVQRCLAELARHHDVAIITGRAVADARRMLSFEPRYLIGNHGIEGLPGWRSRAEEFEHAVRGWRDTLERSQGLRAAGVSVEDKTYSMSLHFRRAADPAAAQRAIGQCVATLQPSPRVIAGKSVVNLLACEAPDKGDALRALIEATRASAVLYVGDDDTDETVFALDLPGVLSVRVEPDGDTAATLFLRDQREVLTLIQYAARGVVPRVASSCECRLP